MNELRVRPPRSAERLIEWSLPETDREVVLGDLQEEFEATADRAGRAAAVREYLWQTARSVGSNLVRRRRELVDRYRAEDAAASNEIRPLMRTYGSLYLDLLIVVALILLATYSMNFWLLLLVPPAGLAVFVRALFRNPYLSPVANQLDRARRTRRVHFFAALLFPANLLTSLIWGPHHTSAWTVVPIVVAFLISQWWPASRWPIARASDPVES